MTAFTAGALSQDTKEWKAIAWRKARRVVRRMQLRIAKAVKEGRWNKVKALQRLLTRSFYAKALAVKRVTSNKGKKTPGVDGVIWRNARDKSQAIRSLRSHGYKAKPLRRIYIPKKNGKKRPLSIPIMQDRAMQALYKLALAPIAETTADQNSYGFREGRCCADAMCAAFNALAKPNSATWVLEADITGCFDNISQKWMLKNIPVEGKILRQWLRAGYIEKGAMFPTRKGTPQGGIISPALANMTLDGLEQTVRKCAPRRSRINFVRYADDFIVTGKSERLLEENVLPAIKKFLSERGLSLSTAKTKITYIKDGFTFLGQTYRKHGRTLHITPSTEGIRSLLRKVGTLIRQRVSAPITALIKTLNDTLRGWANFHRNVVASLAFRRVDSYVYAQLWRMIRRRHSNKSRKWLAKKYWLVHGRNWIFSTVARLKEGLKTYQVLRTCRIKIKRHIKIIAKANPYDPDFSRYFWERRHKKESRLMPELSARLMRRAKVKEV